MNTNEPTTPSAIRSGEPLWCADCKSYHPIGLHTGTPSDAPTDGSAVEWAQTKMITREDIDGDLFKCLQEDDAIELARRADEARAELARLKANNRYQRGYHDGEQAAREELKTPTPPTEGSAVEWAIKQWADWVAGKGGSIMQDTIMPLARRADEAEKPEWRQACMKIGVLLAPITQAAGVAEAVEELYIQRADLLHQVGDLRAQLAAAQARADLEADNALELARRADEAEFWAKSWKANHDNQVRLKRALADRPDLKERAASWKKLNDDNEAIRAQLAAAQAEAGRLREALEEIGALEGMTLIGPGPQDGEVEDEQHAHSIGAAKAFNQAAKTARDALAKKEGER